MKIRISRGARSEINHARRHLAKKSAKLGDRFTAELKDAFSQIGDDPRRFPKVETLSGDHPYHRFLLPTFRYLIIYQVMEKEIEVIAVPHGSQEPNYWLGR